MKRIVICCDGTWNSPDQTRGGTLCPTNVVRFAKAVQTTANNVRQLTYYDAGIGSSGGWLDRRIDGATGRGLERNLREAYAYLSRVYDGDAGDEIFLLGFSRGAFTVRSLAGLIVNSGVLRPEHQPMIDAAMALYRSRSPEASPRAEEATLFRRTYAWADRTPIRMIGVWDTVGALGNPLFRHSLVNRKLRFHDVDLSSTVANAFHAIAIDERRKPFKPTLWKQTEKGAAAGQRLEQRWFAGAQSDGGGGYEERGVSDVTLGWMAARAAECGLGLDPIALAPRHDAPQRDEMSVFYRLLGRYLRPIDEPAAAEAAEQGKSTPDASRPAFVGTGEIVDDTARWRLRDVARYRPANLLDYLRRRGEPAPPA